MTKPSTEEILEMHQERKKLLEKPSILPIVEHGNCGHKDCEEQAKVINAIRALNTMLQPDRANLAIALMDVIYWVLAGDQLEQQHGMVSGNILQDQVAELEELCYERFTKAFRQHANDYKVIEVDSSGNAQTKVYENLKAQREQNGRKLDS